MVFTQILAYLAIGLVFAIPILIVVTLVYLIKYLKK